MANSLLLVFSTSTRQQTNITSVASHARQARRPLLRPRLLAPRHVRQGLIWESNSPPGFQPVAQAGCTNRAFGGPSRGEAHHGSPSPRVSPT
jgi:hypothetical protein